MIRLRYGSNPIPQTHTARKIKKMNEGIKDNNDMN